MTLLALLLLAQVGAGLPAAPVLEFPEPGLDDTLAYQGYRTRFYRDAVGDAHQVYVDGRSGRVVALWADAANESLGFTVRDTAGRPAAPAWGASDAVVSGGGDTRSVAFRLAAGAAPLDLGLFMLGSMRLERDFQYGEGHLRPFGGPAFIPDELVKLVAALDPLPPAERARHVALLRARTTADLRARLEPTITAVDAGTVLVEQPSFDGRDRLQLELRVDPREARLDVSRRTVRLLPALGRSPVLTVTATTTAAALTPLERGEIFNPAFLAFYERARASRDSALAAGAHADDPRVLRFRWLDRQLRGVELVSYREKLMAGLPNFATYFGRDDMLSVLLMEPVWTPAMPEAVIGAVLRKLAPTGEVSHEESLGGQAIRENAVTYDSLVAAYAAASAGGDRERAADALSRARAVLGDLQAVRENYRMVDDEFQLPVVVARYLGSAAVPAARKKAFLLGAASGTSGESRLVRLLRELAFVARRTAPYVREPLATNLVDFPAAGEGRWMSGSWRDSNAGYGNGRFAMDINVVWAPAALRSLHTILAELRALGYDADALLRQAPELRGSALERYLRRPDALAAAVTAWSGTARHFRVALAPAEARTRLAAKLAWLPPEEGAFWTARATAHPPGAGPLEFLALSLDGEGKPVAVVNTDAGMRLLLDAPPTDAAGRDADLRDVRAVLLGYPVGLFIDGVGPVVANDAYAPPAVWDAFRSDLYHSPRVVWGREVNVLLSALAGRIGAAYTGACRLRDARSGPYVRELQGALDRIAAAVEASGLKHNELWSYRIEGGRVRPVRYQTSSDVQLWNLTDLAVQFALARVPRCALGT